MSTVAVLGTGAMGSRMALRLLAAGHTVTVYNRTAERAAPLVTAGARLAQTPRAAARGADVVVSMLTDDAAARTVWLDAATGALGGLHARATAVESSTVSPGWVTELAGAVTARGAECLDAPVVGSRPQADAGHLVYLVGGDTDVLDRVRPVLAPLGAAVHHVGPVGAGATVKLAVNALFAVQVVAVGEWLAALRRVGLDPARLLDALGTLPVLSPAARVAAGRIASGDVTPQFPIALVEKDLRYGLALATGDAPNGAPPDDAQSRAPMTHAAWEQFARAIARGFGGDHITGVAQLLA